MSHTIHQHVNGSVSLVADGDAGVDRMQRYFAALYRESPHYRSLMDRLGLSPQSPPLEILGRLPNTSRDAYRDVLQFEALSRLNRARFVCDFSSGSTDRCVLHLSTPHDELGEQAITEQVLRRAGLRRGDTFVCMDVGFPEIYDFYFRAARTLGVRRTTYLHLNRDYARCLKPIRALAPNVLLTLPSILVRAWPHVRGLWPRGRSPIRSLIHMGEPMPATFKREVAETLGCGVYSFYGTTETGGMAGECRCGTGCHFDPSLICPTIAKPVFRDDRTVRGEMFLTTWYLSHQSVVKYRVGDIVEITTRPCPCGEATPRLTVLERTHDSFILTGMKLRYQTILEALRRVATGLEFLAITLSDLPEAEGHTLLQVSLSKRFAQHRDDLLHVLRYEIFELDDFYHFGLVRFQLDFRPDEQFDQRKIRRITDNRSYLGEGCSSAGHSLSGEKGGDEP
jgi:phenylacetate-CoA ligase